MSYKDEAEIAALIDAFESATIEREDWKHAEHLVVALHYIRNHDLEIATQRMRDGIFKLLTLTFKVDLTKEMPYHETLTVFWMETVAAFAKEMNGKSLVDLTNEMVSRYDKDYPLKFYSRDRLFSDEARRQFVAPDLV